LDIKALEAAELANKSRRSHPLHSPVVDYIDASLHGRLDTKTSAEEERERREKIRVEATNALGAIRDNRALQPLVAVLALSKREAERAAAAEALGAVKGGVKPVLPHI
jgi:HEAT repeat protein